MPQKQKLQVLLYSATLGSWPLAWNLTQLELTLIYLPELLPQIHLTLELLIKQVKLGHPIWWGDGKEKDLCGGEVRKLCTLIPMNDDTIVNISPKWTFRNNNFVKTHTGISPQTLKVFTRFLYKLITRRKRRNRHLIKNIFVLQDKNNS